MLAIMLAWQVSMAQNRTVTGTVKDQSGEPIIGASIIVKGTTSGTYSDESGNFTIVLSTNATALIIKYLGFKSQEIPLTASNVVTVTLEEDVLGLEEVVVTALGISKEKKSLGYSTQEIGGDRIENSGETNVVEALSSKFSGVLVTGTSGTPGSSSKIVIRGPSTFTNENQPLIVVDGVPIDNSTNATVAGDYPFNPFLQGANQSNRAIDINPDDIESINVLKGPAASALYGAKAGSGVIVITTKRGKSKGGKGVSFTVNSSIEFSKVDQLPEKQTTYAQGTGGGFFDSTGVTVQPEGNYFTSDPGPDFLWHTADDVSQGTPNQWGPLIAHMPDSLGVTSHDNPGEFFQTGVTYNNNFSISSASENGSLRFSVGNVKETGIIPNSSFNRTSFRLNADGRVNSKFTVGTSVNYVKGGGNFVQNGSNLSGVMLSLMRTPPSYDLAAGFEYPSGANRNYFSSYDNPYWTIYNNPEDNQVNRVIGNAYLTYAPLSWFNVTDRIGTDFYTDYRKQIFSIGSNQPANAPGGQIEEDTRRYSQIYNDLLLNFTKQFSTDFEADLTIGNNLIQEYSQDHYSRGRDLTVPDFFNLSNASDLYSSESNITTRTAAWLGILGLNWKSTVFLNLTGRNEWSSTWGPNTNSIFYPSANVSFVFTELMQPSNILSYGKIRLAYAQAGINPQAYSANTVFIQPLFTDGFTDGFSFPYLGENGFGYSQLNILGNPDLKPEKQIGKEVGLELKLFRGRLGLEATYYNQTSQDILVVRPIASSSGFSYVYANAGEMVNKGVEIGLDATVIKSKSFEWMVGGNFSKNKNEVTKIADGLNKFNVETTFGDPEPYAIVGQPYGVLYGTAWAKDPNGNIICDADGFPIVADSFEVIGDPYPDWLANIRTELHFKGFTLSGLLDIRVGGDIWAGTIARMNRIGATQASADHRGESFVIDGVVENGDGSFSPNTVPIQAYDYFSYAKGDFGASEAVIYDAGWVRLRELSLSYSFDFSKEKGNPIQQLTLTASARNLFVSTDYPGVDPENSLTGAGSNAQGLDWFNNPGTKSYMFAISFGF